MVAYSEERQAQASRPATYIGPQPGPQEEFLKSSADITVYGGAAGGGKTFGLLMEPLRHVHLPLFESVCFRRTSPQITQSGGMWEKSRGMYAPLGAKSNSTDLLWEWPSGAKTRFSHLKDATYLEGWA